MVGFVELDEDTKEVEGFCDVGAGTNEEVGGTVETLGVKVLTNEGAVDDGEIEVDLVGVIGGLIDGDREGRSDGTIEVGFSEGSPDGFMEGLLGVREGRPEGVIVVGEELGFRVEGKLLCFVVGG